MFTGIIECLGKIVKIEQEGTNQHFTIESPISSELRIDQSIAHNGVCLTVVDQKNNRHTVTAIEETLKRSNLRGLDIGSKVNLERCMKADARIDGHFVQGHVDTVAKCINVESLEGSWIYEFELADTEYNNLLVDKGSITIDGTSLTLVKSNWNDFSVAIIPYTYENTVFNQLQKGDLVNIEFDILGKYINKILASRNA
ncbi:MAG: riboflavin synthase [Bacteroidia bacterium]|nr:riboflavin synthase [Bacteroidia bacterium]